MPMDLVDEDLSAIVSLLADDCTRTILIETTTKPLSAEELSERCDVSPQTIYRRLETLRNQDLVTEVVRPEAGGHHYKVYTATFDRAVINLTPNGLELSVSRRDRMADRFIQFIDEVRDR